MKPETRLALALLPTALVPTIGSSRCLGHWALGAASPSLSKCNIFLKTYLGLSLKESSTKELFILEQLLLPVSSHACNKFISALLTKVSMAGIITQWSSWKDGAAVLPGTPEPSSIVTASTVLCQSETAQPCVLISQIQHTQLIPGAKAISVPHTALISTWGQSSAQEHLVPNVQLFYKSVSAQCKTALVEAQECIVSLGRRRCLCPALSSRGSKVPSHFCSPVTQSSTSTHALLVLGQMQCLGCDSAGQVSPWEQASTLYSKSEKTRHPWPLVPSFCLSIESISGGLCCLHRQLPATESNVLKPYTRAKWI